jgi:ribosome modulation factor
MGTPAWNRGYQDFTSGQDQTQNPYTDPEEKADWDTGWSKAKKESAWIDEGNPICARNSRPRF